MHVVYAREDLTHTSKYEQINIDIFRYNLKENLLKQLQGGNYMCTGKHHFYTLLKIRKQIKNSLAAPQDRHNHY